VPGAKLGGMDPLLPDPPKPLMPTQAENDVLQARLNARNCLLYENDPGPAELNVGTASEPRMLPRSEAWQHAYALYLLVDLDADHARLTAAASKCREEAAKPQQRRNLAWIARELSRAVDLCEQAARMVEDAGATEDDTARRRLLAGCRHETEMLSLGNALPSVAESAAEDYQRAQREIDREL
jgi:hypothetical protein